MREEFRIGRLNDSADLNLNVRRAKFRAEVKSLNRTTAFKSHACRCAEESSGIATQLSRCLMR
jgi:hypothetical protein